MVGQPVCSGMNLVFSPGDIRQCLVALSDNPEVRNLFNYRFADGRFEGQSLGNIILSGLELQHEGNFEDAVRIAVRFSILEAGFCQ